MADFFEEQQTQPEEQNEVIKLGDKEYTQDQLSRLVGLGEMAEEAETKYKTKIDRVWPEYVKKNQQISELEQKLHDYEVEKRVRDEAKPAQPTQPQTLSPEQRAEALKQLDDLLKDSSVVRQMAREESQSVSAAKDLIGDIQYLITDAEEQGNPTTTVDELLNYMQTNGVRNPSAAYKLMFENELREVEMQKLQSLRQPGMVTTSQTTAGAKQPAPVRVTRDNLKSLVEEALNRQEV